MADGLDPQDWAATWDGTDGTLVCGGYRARFTSSRGGIIKIIWRLDGAPEPGPNYGEVNRAAQQAAALAVNGG